MKSHMPDHTRRTHGTLSNDGRITKKESQQPMNDSGKRQQFETGAVRDTNDDKPRPDLISPYANQRVGEWLGAGARKYSERNWEKGIPISRCIASLCRHLMKYQMGMRDEDHMAAVMTNAMFILHYEEMVRRGLLPAQLVDMPFYEQQVKGGKSGSAERKEE
jgi:hypothetical protein